MCLFHSSLGDKNMLFLLELQTKSPLSVCWFLQVAVSYYLLFSTKRANIIGNQPFKGHWQ
uniref:Uncharacterized protein n=1 Tax=Piliocolobus tephrosceles TaxID=591936 RepID=A0A8C9J1F2_9PRIM